MGLIKQRDEHRPGGEQRAQVRDCAGLRRQLDDAQAAERRRAVRDLRDCPEASTALVAKLADEHDSAVREAILVALTAIGDDVAVAGLLGCLRSEDVALRNATIEAMQALPEQVAPIMSALLCDGSSDVRIFAVNVLESLRHPEVESWLLTVIEQDPHVNVCATAVDLLGELATPQAREPLEQLKTRFASEPYIQFAADLALSRLGDG